MFPCSFWSSVTFFLLLYDFKKHFDKTHQRRRGASLRRSWSVSRQCTTWPNFWRRANFFWTHSMRATIVIFFVPKRLYRRRKELYGIGCSKVKGMSYILMLMLNRVGNSREPCGTPALIKWKKVHLWFKHKMYSDEIMNSVWRGITVLYWFRGVLTKGRWSRLNRRLLQCQRKMVQ